MQVRRVAPDDKDWLTDTISGAFASTRVVSKGQVHEDASILDGFVVENDGRPVGCALWREIEGDAELVVIVTTYRGAGAGGALLDAVVEYARANGWSRLWLVTTNDNTDAIRLYQRAGWEWVDFHRDSVTDSRPLKPELPETGAHGIPIRHEIELEFPL
ncbi:MAG TPA: GNAT family N-acetyltransferase [Acidimicrobiia bacterium]|nr:GNAT family N-acetyltransferase [Acidimicrobiia bacterium]